MSRRCFHDGILGVDQDDGDDYSMASIVDGTRVFSVAVAVQNSQQFLTRCAACPCCQARDKSFSLPLRGSKERLITTPSGVPQLFFRKATFFSCQVAILTLLGALISASSGSRSRVVLGIFLALLPIAAAYPVLSFLRIS
jgi:hypothetical protein